MSTWPAVARGNRLMTSMLPFVILVAIPSAWKKPVCAGSIPVRPASRNTLIGAQEPAELGIRTYIQY